jgi:hypothetical protein
VDIVKKLVMSLLAVLNILLLSYLVIPAIASDDISPEDILQTIMLISEFDDLAQFDDNLGAPNRDINRGNDIYEYMWDAEFSKSLSKNSYLGCILMGKTYDR